MEYTIKNYDTEKVIAIRRSIKGAYNFCKKLKGVSNFNIQEFDEENDEYTSVNADSFVYQYEENAIKDFGTFASY